MTTPDEVLEYWFGPEDAEPGARSDLWWGQVDDQEAVDDEIERRFGDAVERALEGGFEDWADDPREALARILLLDQFPRHIHRGTARAFAGGDLAVEITRRLRKSGDDKRLDVQERIFSYMPLMHAEDRQIQEESLEAYRKLAEEAPEATREMAEETVEHAREHAEIVEKFGRYPHRNPALGRESTDEEREYLEATEKFFGQAPDEAEQ